MIKIPKFLKTELCFVAKIPDENVKKSKWRICSDWAVQNQDKAFGCYSMNYGKNEPRLAGTSFTIFRFKNTKDIIKHQNSLRDLLSQNGFVEIKESERDVEKILKLL